MPLAAIIDISESKKMSKDIRLQFQNRIRECLKNAYQRFKKYLLNKPAISAGDSIEIISSCWEPIGYIITSIISIGVPVKIGIGTGEITILAEYADESDGPALWNARNALERAKSRGIFIEFIADNKKYNDELKMLILYLLYLNRLRKEIVSYLLEYVWHCRSLSEIARKSKKTLANLSQIAKRNNFEILKRIIRFNCLI